MMIFWLKLLIICFTARCSNTFKAAALDHVWTAYRDVFPKPYENDAKDSERLDMLRQNAEMIARHNIEADLGQHSYFLGLTNFGDMTDEEVESIITCVPQDVPLNETEPEYYDPPEQYQMNHQIPKSFDNRKLNIVAPVRNQRLCNDCYAFGALGALEGQWAKKTGILVELSVQNYLDCNILERRCSRGGFPQYAYEYIIYNGGIDTENHYPYIAKDEPCKFDRRFIGATERAFDFVEPNSEVGLMSAVYKIGPIATLINAKNTGFVNYKGGGVYRPKYCSNYYTHVVLVVGYGSENGIPYWLLKNSWGTYWGDGGYMKLIRDKRGSCAVYVQPTYPIV